MGGFGKPWEAVEKTYRDSVFPPSVVTIDINEGGTRALRLVNISPLLKSIPSGSNCLWPRVGPSWFPLLVTLGYKCVDFCSLHKSVRLHLTIRVLLPADAKSKTYRAPSCRPNRFHFFFVFVCYAFIFVKMPWVTLLMSNFCCWRKHNIATCLHCAKKEKKNIWRAQILGIEFCCEFADRLFVLIMLHSEKLAKSLARVSNRPYFPTLSPLLGFGLQVLDLNL